MEISSLNVVGHEPYTVQTPPKTEKQTYEQLVSEYLAAPSKEESQKINERLISQYQIDLDSRKYNGKSLPVSNQRTVNDVAKVAFTLFEIDSKRAPQGSAHNIGIFARTLDLLKREVEIARALFAQPELQKKWLSKALESHLLATKQLGKLDDKITQFAAIGTLLQEIGQLLDKPALQKEFSGEADFYLLKVDDKLTQIKDKSTGILHRLLGRPKAEGGLAYVDDLKQVNDSFIAFKKMFIAHDQQVVQRAPWQVLKEEADNLQQAAEKFDPTRPSSSIHESLEIVSLRFKTNDLQAKLIFFLEEHVENAFA